ncbi:hypothetical protein [uncultured Chloroflexus sp.]|uniref:hypothetical protein n=1 Tax=uncultured Chloroflexus sp. TaxID=214040 RepID=UPI002623BCAF|nr:hypothetical protein [uncultured Chloroflexus sp.]
MHNRTFLSRVLLVTILATIALAAPPASVAVSASATPTPTLTITTNAITPRTAQDLEESPISALLGRYATWLMLVMCSSMLALVGATAIVARMRRIAGDDDD